MITVEKGPKIYYVICERFLSFLRLKIGKYFSDANLENMKKEILDDCRSRIRPISIKQIDHDLN